MNDHIMQIARDAGGYLLGMRVMPDQRPMLAKRYGIPEQSPAYQVGKGQAKSWKADDPVFGPSYTELYRQVQSAWRPVFDAYVNEPKSSPNPVTFPRLADSNLEQIRLALFPHTEAAEVEDALRAAEQNFLKWIKQFPLGVKQGAAAANVLDQVNRLLMTHPGAPGREMLVADAVKAKDSPILIRGEAESTGEVVPRRMLQLIGGPDRPRFEKGSGRLELAHAIASRENPLTARVLVNRVWQHHFGTK